MYLRKIVELKWHALNRLHLLFSFVAWFCFHHLHLHRLFIKTWFSARFLLFNFSRIYPFLSLCFFHFRRMSRRSCTLHLRTTKNARIVFIVFCRFCVISMQFEFDFGCFIIIVGDIFSSPVSLLFPFVSFFVDSNKLRRNPYIFSSFNQIHQSDLNR